jgi:hypothetical protein
MLMTVLISAGLMTSTSAYARGPGGGGGAARGGNRNNAVCDLSGPGQGTPLRDGSGKAVNKRGNPNATGSQVRDGSGKAINNRGNPNSTGTPMRDGSGKATAPGNGPKDGTGNNPQHPVSPNG